MRIVAVFVLVCGFCLPMAGDDEGKAGGTRKEKITLEQVPEKARATIVKNARGQKLHELKRGVEKGKTIYTAEIKDKKTETKIVVDVEGNLIRITTEKEDH